MEKNRSHHSSMHITDNEEQPAPSLEAVSSKEEDMDDAIEIDNDVEEANESSEAELGFVLLSSNEHLPMKSIERLLKDWVSPIYVFFKPKPSIEYIKGRRVHVFTCTAPDCKGRGNGRDVCRYLDTTDAKSTGNLRKHAKICWGEDVVAAADATKDVHAARQALGKYKDSSITAAFRRVSKGKVTYSHRQHTAAEARYVFLL